MAKELATLRAELAESERRRSAADQHASATETEIRSVRAQHQQYTAQTPPEESFGFRAEKLLRLAEQEAAEVRGNATREATAMVEQARSDAEHHRHEVEQALIARAGVLDQQAAQRALELQEREQQIADQLASARAEAETLHEATRRAADQYREQAQAEADEVRARAAHTAERMREAAIEEVSKLGDLQNTARAELGRLADLLTHELAKPVTTPPRAMTGGGAPRELTAAGAETAESGDGEPADADEAGRDEAGRKSEPAEPEKASTGTAAARDLPRQSGPRRSETSRSSADDGRHRPSTVATASRR